MKYADYLTEDFVDVHDLLQWNQKQMDNCDKNEYLFIFKKFQNMLEKLKNSQDNLNFNQMFPIVDIVDNVSSIDTT